MKIHHGLVLFSLTGSLPILAQSDARYEARYFKGASGDTLPYRILFPEGYGKNGAQDQVVPVEESRTIQKAGGKVKYTEYPKAKHNSWDNAFAEPKLFSQRKPD
jgi:hypothetical protein